MAERFGRDLVRTLICITNNRFGLPEAEGGGTEKYMRMDYSIDCDGHRYQAHVAFALAMLAVYPFGKKINPTALHNPTLNHLAPPYSRHPNDVLHSPVSKTRHSSGFRGDG